MKTSRGMSCGQKVVDIENVGGRRRLSYAGRARATLVDIRWAGDLNIR